METSTALSIFDKMIGLLGLIKTGKIIRNDQVDTALRTAHKVLIETEAYIKSSSSENRNYQKERQLA